MQYELEYNGERLIIQRNPPTARMKRLRLNVHPDTRITLSAPKRTSDKTIQRFIDAHADWLYAQFNHVKEQYQPPPQYAYTDGELHWFIGKQYPLEINQSHKSITDITALSSIQLTVNQANEAEKVKATLQLWYKEQALAHFTQRVQQLITLTPWVTQTPLIKVRKMKRQWGNCAQAGHITLNTHLIKAPSNCIDYVLLHELCHLQEFNHNPKFYTLMTQVMPDWRAQKMQLSTLTRLLTA